MKTARFSVRWSSLGVVMRRHFVERDDADDFAAAHTCLGNPCKVDVDDGPEAKPVHVRGFGVVWARGGA